MLLGVGQAVDPPDVLDRPRAADRSVGVGQCRPFELLDPFGQLPIAGSVPAAAQGQDAPGTSSSTARLQRVAGSAQCQDAAA